MDISKKTKGRKKGRKHKGRKAERGRKMTVGRTKEKDGKCMGYRMEEIEGMEFYKRVAVQISTGITLVGI